MFCLRDIVYLKPLHCKERVHLAQPSYFAHGTERRAHSGFFSLLVVGAHMLAGHVASPVASCVGTARLGAMAPPLSPLCVTYLLGKVKLS